MYRRVWWCLCGQSVAIVEAGLLLVVRIAHQNGCGETGPKRAPFNHQLQVCLIIPPINAESHGAKAHTPATSAWAALR